MSFFSYLKARLAEPSTKHALTLAAGAGIEIAAAALPQYATLINAIAGAAGIGLAATPQGTLSGIVSALTPSTTPTPPTGPAV